MRMMNAAFVSLNAFAMVRENRPVERPLFDLTAEFRAQAAECQELANRWDDECKRQYEKLARQWLEIAELVDRRRICRRFAQV